MIRMEQHALDEIEPGVQLAAAVSDSAGGVLLAAGTELTASLIASLQRRGISHVPVAVQICSDELSAQQEKIRNRIGWLFRNGGDDPLMSRLREAVLEYRLEEGL